MRHIASASAVGRGLENPADAPTPQPATELRIGTNHYGSPSHGVAESRSHHHRETGLGKSGSQLVYQFQPLEDSRWGEFLERHPHASLFHTAGWLEALQRTYGYEPIAFTTSPPGTSLQNAIVACRVNSWLTGHRLVSLPFADHCEPLVNDPTELPAFFSVFERTVRQERLRYIELRPIHPVESPTALCRSTCVYCFHQLNLRPDLDTLFQNFHKDSTQRKILRAQREGLCYEEGLSESLLNTFYRLFVLTRRRHHIPPPPKRWFRNLIDCFGNTLKVRLALKDRHPVASMLTIRFKDTLVYKYGCSDPSFHNLGSVHLLFWRAIQEAKQEGLSLFDLGRSDCEDAGLITFKNRWGATRLELTYSRYALSMNSKGHFRPAVPDWKTRIARTMIPHLPDSILTAIGALFYKHAG